jgi:hypothetical protein
LKILACQHSDAPTWADLDISCTRVPSTVLSYTARSTRDLRRARKISIHILNALVQTLACHHLHVEHCNATLGCWCYAERITPTRHSRLSEHRWKAATMLSACKAANFPAWLPRVFVWTSCLGFTTDGIGNTCQNRRRRNIDLAVSAHLQCDTVDGMSVTLTCDPFRSGMSFPSSRRASE